MKSISEKIAASSTDSQWAQWTHDLRNALSSAILATDAARVALASGQCGAASAALEHVEGGFEQCTRLLQNMPSTAKARRSARGAARC